MAIIFIKFIRRQLQLRKKYNPFSINNIKALKGFISIYPAIAAVCLAFFKDPIVNSTGNASDYIRHLKGTSNYTLNAWVLLYWILLTGWIISYFKFVTNESLSNKRNTDGLKSAIFRSPNPKVFGEYEVFYKQIMIQLNLIDRSNVLKHQVNFINILETICLLTSSYINHSDSKVIYGANIMLYLPSKFNGPIIEKLKKKKDEWIHFQYYDLSKFIGVLYLVPELTFRNDGIKSDGEKGNKLPPSITLPIICADQKGDIQRLNIPGAPRAAIEGNFLFSDTKDENAYKHLGETELKIAQEYWKTKLPEISSMVSFAIPLGWQEDLKRSEILDIIGVLNIDSTDSNILGTDIEYHTTFKSLMYPILCQFGPFLKTYYDLYIKELEKTI